MLANTHGRFILSSNQLKRLFWVTLVVALVSTLFLGDGTHVSTAEGRYVPLSLWIGLEVFYVGRLSTKLNKPNFYTGFVALAGAALTAVFAAVFCDPARSWAASFIFSGPIMVTVLSVCASYSLAYLDPKPSTEHVAPATSLPPNDSIPTGFHEAGSLLEESSPSENNRLASGTGRATLENDRATSGFFSLADPFSSSASNYTDLADEAQLPAFALTAEDMAIAGPIPSPWADDADMITDVEHGSRQAHAAPQLGRWARIKRGFTLTRR